MMIQKKHNGFTLIEVIVLIVILSLVGITLGATMVNMLRISTTSFVVKKATILASNKIEDIKAFKSNNAPGLVQAYLNANFNGSETIDGYTITSSWTLTLGTAVPPNTQTVDLYGVTVSVSHDQLGTPASFSTGFALRQLN